MTFWNLAEQGPMVVEVPAGATAGGLLDIWQRPITDTGQTGPDRGGGGKYLIVPPGSDIREMRGYIVARSPSNQVWFAARALDRDPKVAEEVACKHKVYGWSQRGNPPATTFIPVGGKAWVSAHPVGLDYWQAIPLRGPPARAERGARQGDARHAGAARHREGYGIPPGRTPAEDAD